MDPEVSSTGSMTPPTDPGVRGRSTNQPSTPITSPFNSRSSSKNSSRPKTYRCDYEGCDKIYSRPSLLTQHQRSHTDSRPFSCDQCDSSFFRESHLKRHQLSHAQERPFKCSICGKGVNTKQHLKRHEITHTKSFKCDHEDCNESFYKHQQLRHHVQSVHLKTLTCKECGKTFPRPYRLANHITKHHGAEPAYHCDFPGCYGSFKTWSALQLHMKTDHPKLTCSVCGKGCVGQEGLRMHMLVHDDERSAKIWKCTECPEDFAKKDELVNHCQATHKFIPHNLQTQDKQPQPPVKSQEQSVTAVRSDTVERVLAKGQSSVELLLKSVASPLKTIPCTFKNCSRTFRRDYDLQRHLAWHEKQREIFAAKGLLMVSGTSTDNETEEEMADDLVGVISGTG